MEQVEQNEYYQALSLIVCELQFELALAAADDVASGQCDLPVAAEACLSQAIAVLSGPRSAVTHDPVPMLARAGALIALELARIVRIRRQVAAGELVSSVLLEEEGSDIAVQVFRVTHPFTGRLAGYLKNREEAEALLRRLLGPIRRLELAPSAPQTVETPGSRLLLSPGGVS